MIRKTHYTMAQGEKTAMHLRSLPEKQADKHSVTTRELIEKLQPEINDLKKKGYTLEEIAAELTKSGIAVKPSTLRQYSRGGKKTRRAKKSDTHSATPLHTVEKTKTETERDTQKATQQATPSVVSEGTLKGNFTPKADTKDI
ncbi:mobilization protein MobC [Xanthomonas perforans]|uniref:mobilization protein MobC n=2 Tax=Xanthomonas perforans TaxID=442694 RepID=UPI003B676352